MDKYIKVTKERCSWCEDYIKGTYGFCKMCSNEDDKKKENNNEIRINQKRS